MDSVKQTTLQGWVGFIQSAEGLNKRDWLLLYAVASVMSDSLQPNRM